MTFFVCFAYKWEIVVYTKIIADGLKIVKTVYQVDNLDHTCTNWSMGGAWAHLAPPPLPPLTVADLWFLCFKRLMFSILYRSWYILSKLLKENMLNNDLYFTRYYFQRIFYAPPVTKFTSPPLYPGTATAHSTSVNVHIWKRPKNVMKSNLLRNCTSGMMKKKCCYPKLTSKRYLIDWNSFNMIKF